MLDLSVQNNQFYEVKDIDGDILFLKPPKQNDYMKLSKIQQIDDLQVVFDIADQILNNNTANKKIDISIYSLQICLELIKDYYSYWNKCLSGLVFQQSQQMKTTN